MAVASTLISRLTTTSGTRVTRQHRKAAFLQERESATSAAPGPLTWGSAVLDESLKNLQRRDAHRSPVLRREKNLTARELRDVNLDEGLAVLATLGALRGPRSKLPASALAELLSRRRELERTCEVLVAWGRAT